MREGERTCKKTLANLSKLPPEVVDGFRTVLKGVRDVRGTCRQLGLERILNRRGACARPQLGYLERRLRPLAAFGYDLDGKRGKRQIVRS